MDLTVKKLNQNNMEKTAVEWLVEQFNLQAYIPHIEQAKEMEKQQMKKAQMHYSSDVVGFKTLLEKQFDEWYNETFKSE